MVALMAFAKKSSETIEIMAAMQTSAIDAYFCMNFILIFISISVLLNWVISTTSSVVIINFFASF